MLQRSFRLALLACFLVQGVAAAALEVRGRVVDEEGRPVSRAKVLLSRVAPQHQSFRDVLGGRLEAEAVETAKTSKDGRYSLSAPEPGMWQVTVHARGKIPIRRRLTPLVDHVDLEDAEVRVDAGLEVLVVAENGDPVPRAQVWIRSIEGRPGRSRARRSQWRDRGRFAMTGEDGRAHLSRPRGESQRARAWASGFLISEEGEAVDGSSGTLTLQRGWRARVRFSRGKDEPMADTILVVQNETSTWIAGVTDAEGRAEFALQPGRPLAIGLRSADGSRFGAALERTAYELENPPLRPETIVVPPAVELTGRVIDNKKREPVAGAFVWPAGDEGHFARTDTEGGYKIAIGAGESRRLGAGAAGYKGNFAPVERDETPPRGPTLALAPAASLEGRVVDEEGNGVGGAQVAAVQAGRWRSPKTQTRADGSFRLTELEPEGAYELVASAPGFAPTGKAVRLEPELMIEIVMLPGRALTGRVVDEGKAPIPGAEILLLPVATDFRQRVRGNNTAGPPPSATTDTDGAFRIDGLGDEPVAVVARNAGFATRMITGFDTESEQPVIDVGEVVLSPGEEIHGVVRRSSGAAIEGARVNASSGSMKQYMIPWELTDDLDQTVATGPDGSFVLSDLSAAEPQTVSASHDDYLNERVEGVLPGSEEPIEIVLDRAGRLSGRVLNEQGEPIDDATVRARALESRDGLTARWAGRDWARGRSREDGSFTVTGVYPGRLEITVEARGYRGTDALELELAKGEERTGLNLVVRRGGTLVGSVRDEEGQPVVGAWVNAEPQRTGPMPSRGRASTRSDGEGRFALDGLDSSVGQLEFSISHPDYVAHKEQLSFSPGMRRDVVLESGVAISGFVLSQAGDPISGAEVSVAQSRYSYGGTGQSQSLEDGSFELRGVGPGTYRLRASKTGFAVTTTETSFEVAAVPVRGVTIHLKTGGTIRGRISGLEPADLAEVQVHVRGAEQGTPAFGLVDPEGEYRVVDVGFERGTVFANSAATGQTVQEAFSLDTEGGETRVDLEFRHGAVLSGLVLLDSEPWRGARVGVDGGPASQAYGQVDHDGRFEVRGLSEG
ncbi:MAG: carboxypeptidase-like regulatory domain-containing protein, partial [Acidobacteriota bacterium]|nr:carboxypeptidase-like regulatory domain-containing protein [Acidobacteriota bacterium]